LTPDGTAEVVTGAASVGGGVETAVAQVFSECIPLPPERITVVHGQPTASPAARAPSPHAGR